MRSSLATALFYAFMSLFWDTDTTVQRLSSSLVDNGGSNWAVVGTHVLPMSFFPGGTAEGIAHSASGIVWSGRYCLVTTGPVSPFTSRLSLADGIPAQLSTKYNHIGDISTAVIGGKEFVFASVEDNTYSSPMAIVFTADNLDFVSACPIQQHHTSFLAIDNSSLIMYSSEFFRVDKIERYQYPDCEQLPPLLLKRDGVPTTLYDVQGASVSGDLLYVTTNQKYANKGDIFAIDTRTGEIVLGMDLEVGLGIAEMEGIDVSVQDGETRMLVSANYVSLFVLVTELLKTGT